MTDAWLDWVRRLQAVAQNGLLYATSDFDVQRYEEVRAVAAAIAAARGGGSSEALLASFAAETGHATPKVDVRCAAFRGDDVLLVRGIDDRLWTLPGGWCEVGQTPRVAAETELREESGYAGRAQKLVGIFEHDVRGRGRWPFYAYKLLFLCELEGEPGDPEASEIDVVGFFGEGGVPPLSARTPPELLARAFAHHRDPTLPAEFV